MDARAKVFPASLSAALGERSGEASGAAKRCRTRSMLRLEPFRRRGRDGRCRWKPFKQDVEEKAANELGGVRRHGPEPVALFSDHFTLKKSRRLIKANEPGIGDRDAVSV